MKLKPNQKAPDFTLEEIRGSMESLEKYKGKKLLLSFYRYAGCPLCGLRIHELKARYPEFHKQGLEIVAFIQSPKESVMEFITKNDPPFALISDSKKEVYKKYGVESSVWGAFKGLLQFSQFKKASQAGFRQGKVDGDLKLLPAEFLINPDGTINTAFYAEHIGDHLSFEKIESFLQNK